jgi:hypothetical protein
MGFCTREAGRALNVRSGMATRMKVVCGVHGSCAYNAPQPDDGHGSPSYGGFGSAALPEPQQPAACVSKWGIECERVDLLHISPVRAAATPLVLCQQPDPPQQGLAPAPVRQPCATYVPCE